MGTDIDANLSMRVMMGVLRIQKNKMKIKQKKKPILPILDKTPVRDIVCPLFGISPNKYQDIVNSFLDENKIYKSGKMQEGRSGNTVVHMRRIPVNKAVAKMVQEFVRNERKERRRCTRQHF